ncbi:MAG: DUF692 domain-containing protein [Simkania sp.]|nr:DUF692 domain-containing protein [Simkania sp.]
MVMHGVGLGFRKEIAEDILALETHELAFLELAPENWMRIGGRLRKLLLQAVEKFPITCHGLSLSLGSPEPLDWGFITQLKEFFVEVPIQVYSEHLSYSKCGNAHLYDLLPIPFTNEAVSHVSSRIRQVQEFLGRKIAIENVSYYCSVDPEMEEAEFISRVIKESDCLLLLDINNIYVNAFNHRYDPFEFLKKLPLDRVINIHMAGHEKVSPSLIIDTHASAIIDPVYELFEWVVKHIRPVPVLLERDFNFGDFEGIMKEVGMLKKIVKQHWVEEHVTC